MLILINAVNILAQVIIYMLLARALLSWFIRAPYGTLYKAYDFLGTLTEPLVMPFRKLLARANTGQLDFSVLLAMVAVMFARKIIIRILMLFVI